MNDPQPTAKRTINDARALIHGTSPNARESEFDRVKREFVRLGDFVFRPTEVDWFYLELGTEIPDGKTPDKTVVYCKGQTAKLDDDDHKLYSFLIQYFKPQPMKL